MVNLTRIYTRTGDHGETRLVDMSVTAKTDPRVAAYGDVDEANATIGVALTLPGLDDQVRQVLAQVQNELFDLGADLGNPLAESQEFEPLRITAEYVERLEQWCDGFGEQLPKLRSFILPGGNPAGAQLHVARTIVRRAERTAWHAVEVYGTEPAQSGSDRPGGINPLAIQYLNRLSDLLFILTRVANGTESEVLWVPGGDRNPDRS
ncbi:cob(I)yrinic acid a,c-diamide adenosyltransferase [Microlunatus sp. Gsoil 973]|uniref:cob(I)yrinic acid a,c-diamide adenosyltransferase n=1 Tax=Microlunatus sp. Gsoil 973 TaxID=2672569 RepID=UPI0012B47EDF|nr:cob(I)yrinic acid a,c-diamide adenosyltransferase [Microlunatus sp. Gsoil 973]QGN32328.1 cob(I)yrinic acid a,c-diamide adenosyltransferase [Microlunatus sp. Gsoil 973]